MELRGAVYDEVGCYDGGKVYLTRDGVLEDPGCGEEDCKYYSIAKKAAACVEAVWHDAGGPAWTYKTEIPHDTFEIFDDGEVFCQGIVFRAEDLPG